MEEDNQRHLNRFKNNPPHPSYIAGFIDGDGCIFIRKIIDGYQSDLQLHNVEQIFYKLFVIILVEVLLLQQIEMIKVLMLWMNMIIIINTM